MPGAVTAASPLPEGRALPDVLLEAVALHQAGRASEAAALYRAILAAYPDEPDARHNLAILLAQSGAPWAESLPHFRAAWAVDPGHVQRTRSYLQALVRAGDLHEAARVHEESTRRGVSLPALQADGGVAPRAAPREPTDAESAWRQAQVLGAAGRFAEAEPFARQAVKLRPAWSDAHLVAGQVAMRRARLTEALAALREAVRLAPDSLQAQYDLATVTLWRGDVDGALAGYDRAVALRPTDLALRSTRHFATHYLSGEDRAARLREARDFGARAAAGVKPFTAWRCDPDAHRLRVGFVSADLGDHPVGYFLASTLEALAGSRIECIAYPVRVMHDPVASRLQRSFASWHPLTGLPDAEAARRIEEHGVHVLVDLAGHTALNRLPLFAWCAAPLQLSWLGYFATTGLEGIDALLADQASVAPGDAAYFTEALECLAGTRLCFTPPDDAPAIAPLPALARGHVTFGCFQNLAKVNARVIETWSRVLHALPGSRLVIRNGALADAGVVDELRARMTAAGIDVARVDFGQGLPRAEYFASYGGVDIMLDTFPYPGGTTTCEALWMGVPTVTLAGGTLLSRQGASMLRAAGLDDWVAADPGAYVERAVAAAADLASLAALRATLRERLPNSRLIDARRFAADFESSLLGLWARIGAPRVSASTRTPSP